MDSSSPGAARTPKARRGYTYTPLDDATVAAEEAEQLAKDRLWVVLGGYDRPPRASKRSFHQANLGSFAPEQMYLSEALRPEPIPLRVYYKDNTPSVLAANLLPMLSVAWNAPSDRRTRLWSQVPSSSSNPPDLVASIVCLLDAVAGVLTPPHPDRARYWDKQLAPSTDPVDAAGPSTSSSPAQPSTLLRRFTHLIFECPPVATGGHPTCLRLDPKALADGRAGLGDASFCMHQWRGAGGYLQLYLTKHTRSSEPRVVEWAHRLVAWCAHGPAPPTMAHPVVMHTCHMADCLRPDHLKWGTHAQNKKGIP